MNEEINLKILQQSLPENLAREIADYVWQQNHIGFSSAQIFRLESKNKNTLYLKIESLASKHFLEQEKSKLDWLKNRLPVPEVISFTEDETNAYLLLTEISGAPEIDNPPAAHIPQIVAELTNGLKMIHNLPIEKCPFGAQLNYQIEIARERIIEGLVDEDDFDEERQGRTAEELFQELIATKPSNEDLVFTHGDYCLPNIILKNKKLSGFVDWGNAGIADKYQDLALLFRSIRYNFGKESTEQAFEIYGIKPDWKKIHFYCLLDEFF